MAEPLVAEQAACARIRCSELRVEGRYAPVSIANWKLIPGMARRLLAGRVSRAAVVRRRSAAHRRHSLSRSRASSARNWCRR